MDPRDTPPAVGYAPLGAADTGVGTLEAYRSRNVRMKSLGLGVGRIALALGTVPIGVAMAVIKPEQVPGISNYQFLAFYWNDLAVSIGVLKVSENIISYLCSL